MELRLDRLATHLSQTIAPIYVIHGDEPLLAIEAGDAIREAARKSGAQERETHVADPGFSWDDFRLATANLGLFGGRKLIELRLPTGKPGVAGAKALEHFAAAGNADHVLVVTMPRADRKTQEAAWFAALAHAGVVIVAAPLALTELPRWIAARLARQDQRTDPDTLALLAQRFEGNLLAARQEIEKLALLLPPGELAREAIEHAVADVARFEIQQLSEAWLRGDSARVVRILAALEAEGEALPLIVWQLGEDLHALAEIAEATASGTPLAVAVRSARLWGIRAEAMPHAARRIDRDRLARLLRAPARLDGLAKGIGRGNAWDALRATALALSGASVPLAA